MRLWRDRHLHLSITRLGLEYLAALLMVGDGQVEVSEIGRAHV